MQGMRFFFSEFWQQFAFQGNCLSSLSCQIYEHGVFHNDSLSFYSLQNTQRCLFSFLIFLIYVYLFFSAVQLEVYDFVNLKESTFKFTFFASSVLLSIFNNLAPCLHPFTLPFPELCFQGIDLSLPVCVFFLFFYQGTSLHREKRCNLLSPTIFEYHYFWPVKI